MPRSYQIGAEPIAYRLDDLIEQQRMMLRELARLNKEIRMIEEVIKPTSYHLVRGPYNKSPQAEP